MAEMKKNNDQVRISNAIARLQRFHRRFMTSRLEALDLSGAMHMIIYTLNKNPGVSQDYLAIHFNMDKGIIARQCKALEERNLIRREINPNDRRQYCLYLTEEGTELVAPIAESYKQWNALLCRDLTDEQAETALSLLSSMVESCINDFGDFI